MLYKEARVYLDRVSKYGSVLGLDSIEGLLEELGRPQDDLSFIHIAGTNGKGSIAAMLSAILRESGFCTGTYISPAVMGYMEKFQIDGVWMDESELPFFVEKVKKAAKRLKERRGYTATVFEIETAAAFLYFQKRHCDYVVLETGLGGALDATNIVENVELCIFSSISIDHKGILGGTLEEIARTKAGILRPGVEAVSAPQQPGIRKVLERESARQGGRIRFVDPEEIKLLSCSLEGQTFSYCDSPPIRLSLLGDFQLENAAAALEAVKALRKKQVRIPGEAVLRAMESLQWPGRFQALCKNPVVIADGAHNEDAARRLAENFQRYLPGKSVVGVMGVFRDKEYQKMTDILAPYLEKVYTVDLPDPERTLPKETLRDCWRVRGVCSEAAPDLGTAIRKAKEDVWERCGKGRPGKGEPGSQRECRTTCQETDCGGAVVAFGSLSFLGEAIRMSDSKG